MPAAKNFFLAQLAAEFRGVHARAGDVEDQNVGPHLLGIDLDALDLRQTFGQQPGVVMVFL